MGLFKNILGGVDVQRLIEAKDYDGLLKASAKKDPEVRSKAVQGLASLGEGARSFLVSQLEGSDDLQFTRAAAALKGLNWVPATIDEKALFLIGLNAWEDLFGLGEEAIAPLTRIVKLRKSGDLIRSSALMAIGHFRTRETTKLIADAFQQSFADNSPLDVHFALGCLRRLRSEAVGPLSEILQNEQTPQQTRVWVTQLMAMIGPPAIEALLSVNMNPPGTGLKALESWTFSLQALAGIANDKALSYIKDGALRSLSDNYAAQGKTGLGRRSEEAKAVETILDIFKDPPRSIVKYCRLGGPMRSYQIIAILAAGNRQETEAVKAFNLLGGSGIAESIMGSTDTVTMDALDKIGGDEATKIMIDHIAKNIGAERAAKAIMMIDRNAHPSMLSFLARYGKESSQGFIDKAAGAITLVHLKKGQV